MCKFYAGLLIFFALVSHSASAQDTIGGVSSAVFSVKNESAGEPIAGARIAVGGTNITGVTGADGRIELTGVADGAQIIEVFAEGYEAQELAITFPVADPGEIVVVLKANESEVTISTTRTGREIDDTPTRVEAIDEEEVDEKLSMRPANVSMLLNESTGIKVQQTSAASFTQTVRIQGLNGRYTQILKDGFPAFGGFSGSLSVLDIPPLDLRQVEIIKGASSTFYGAGAIAGVVNFISKEPTDEPATSLIFNQTTALGTDFSVFNTRKFDRFGYTLLGSVNYQNEYDADGDDFTELPDTKSFNVNPRLFFYLNDKSRLMVGNSTTYQNRRGGDIFAVRGRADNLHRYFELNDSLRNITTLQFDRDFSGGRKLVAKQSLAFFTRKIEIPDYRFDGQQFNSYTDLSYFQPLKKHFLIFGFNAAVDRFRERRTAAAQRRDESRTTVGGYVQDNFDVTGKLSLEAGFRLDAVKDYGVFALPRVSLLYKFTERLTSRVSYGLGYKPPTIFTEEAETELFQNVLPVGNSLKAERSRGGTFDINYRRSVGENFSFSINQMFFRTVIADPLVLTAISGGAYGFANADRTVASSGFETNARASFRLLKLFGGYTFTNAKAGYLPDTQILPLTPKSRLNSSLIVEKENDFKAGFEAYYTSRQTLTNRFKTSPFWVIGVFGEKNFGKFSLFVNGENLTDTRQSRFGAVVLPPFQQPKFAEIYAPVEGRIFNGGIKIRLD